MMLNIFNKNCSHQALFCRYFLHQNSAINYLSAPSPAAFRRENVAGQVLRQQFVAQQISRWKKNGKILLEQAAFAQQRMRFVNRSHRNDEFAGSVVIDGLCALNLEELRP